MGDSDALVADSLLAADVREEAVRLVKERCRQVDFELDQLYWGSHHEIWGLRQWEILAGDREAVVGLALARKSWFWRPSEQVKFYSIAVLCDGTVVEACIRKEERRIIRLFWNGDVVAEAHVGFPLLLINYPRIEVFVEGGQVATVRGPLIKFGYGSQLSLELANGVRTRFHDVLPLSPAFPKELIDAGDDRVVRAFFSLSLFMRLWVSTGG